MHTPLSPDRLALLLPVLNDLVEMLRAGATITTGDLRLLTLGRGLDEPWALDELNRWADILLTARASNHPDRWALAERALTQRGLSDETAHAAVSAVAETNQAPIPATAGELTAASRSRLWLLPLALLVVVCIGLALGWTLFNGQNTTPAALVQSTSVALTPRSAAYPSPAPTRFSEIPTLAPPGGYPSPAAPVAAATARLATPAAALPTAGYPARVASPTAETTPAATPRPAASATPALPTRTPRPTATLSAAAAACRPAAGASFARLWADQGLHTQLGCPSNEERGVTTAYQPFQNGLMFYRQDTGQIYVVYNDGSYQEFTDPWREGEPEYSCPNAQTPSTTPPTPRRGFGKVWCAQPGVRDKLGNALANENGNLRPVQDFDRGLMFFIGERDVAVFALLKDTGKWVSG